VSTVDLSGVRDRLTGLVAGANRQGVATWVALLLAEALAVVGYYGRPDVTLVQPRYALYGLVWVNVGLLVLQRVRVPPTSDRTRRRAAAVAVGYFAALAVAGGLVGLSAGPGMGLSIGWLPPGWGPAVLYSGPLVTLVLMPARVIGYLALTYLVYATVVDASSAGVAGLLGLLSCVSCSWPILASIATGVAGAGSAIAAATQGLSYDISTAVFLLTVALLYWRPFGR
jgi:hypothetical protein